MSFIRLTFFVRLLQARIFEGGFFFLANFDGFAPSRLTLSAAEMDIENIQRKFSQLTYSLRELYQAETAVSVSRKGSHTARTSCSENEMSFIPCCPNLKGLACTVRGLYAVGMAADVFMSLEFCGYVFPQQPEWKLAYWSWR